MTSCSTGDPEFCRKLNISVLGPVVSPLEYLAVGTCAPTNPKLNKDNHNAGNRALTVRLNKFLFMAVLSSLLASLRI